jgi:hypothetical protein
VGASLITHGNPAPVFESAEHDFYLVSLLVKFFVVRDWFFSASSCPECTEQSPDKA